MKFQLKTKPQLVNTVHAQILLVEGIMLNNQVHYTFINHKFLNNKSARVIEGLNKVADGGNRMDRNLRFSFAEYKITFRNK